ncbi:MAG: M1 family metallopeptidase [Epulopiscium sp.]|nr:M1 family metallopeptidase [Candidatus Epulonipiscium sp.]
MSAIERMKAFIMIICIALVQIGCYKEIDKDKEPVVVILNEELPNSNEKALKVENKGRDLAVYNKYIVDLKINPKERTFEGIQKIQYTNQTEKPLGILYFNLYLNAFKKNSKIKPYLLEYEDEIHKRGFDEGFIKIESVLINNEEVIFNESETLLEITPREPVEVKEATEIIIQFKGKIPQIAYRIGANDKTLWMGNFLPTIAVYDENGWNKGVYYPVGDSFYTDIANYKVTITTPKDYLVVATGEEEEIIMENDKKTTVEAKMVRDFALGISEEFNKASIETEEGININLYHTSKNIDTKRILKTAEMSLGYFSKTIGSYPYSELDIVEGELFSPTSIEYPTFILIDSRIIRGIENPTSITHAIGHQWFYNIIGNNQAKEPWLDEALVTYLEQYIYLSEKDIDKTMDKKRQELTILMEPMRETSLYSNLSAFSNWESYYNIHYTRGKLMIHALKKKMGDKKFNEFLKTYYEKYAFRNVDIGGFCDTAEEVHGTSLKIFFYKWMRSEELPEF